MQPVAERQRVASIDVLRGFALLGILLINITGFGLPIDAMDDPTLAGGAGGRNLLVWTIMEVVVEGAMFATFSMLFGAGVILLTSRAEARGAASQIAGLYYRRNLWLILFGVVHAYVLLMPGDILYAYGMVALFLFPFRKLKAQHLLLVALALFLVRVPFQVGHVKDVITLQTEAASVQAALDVGESPERRESLKRWKELSAKPTPEEIQEEIEIRTSDYVTIFAYFVPVSNRTRTTRFYEAKLWEVASLMFLGMALMKRSVFSASRSFRYYLSMVLLGYGFGIPLRAFFANNIIASNFDLVSMTLDGETYDLGRIPIALGHVGAVMLFCKAGIMAWLQDLLSAVGRTALTTYLMQTVIWIFLFNGQGLGLLARLERFELYYVVAAIWAVQLIASRIWLSYFRFGPAEWAWRSLTYWELQPGGTTKKGPS